MWFSKLFPNDCDDYFFCRCVHLRPVPGWGRLGPQELSPGRAHPQGPVHSPPGRPCFCHQRGQAQQGHKPVWVSRLQEASSYRLDLHLPAASEDQQEPRPLDPAWCRSVVRHQINLQSNFKILLIRELFKKKFLFHYRVIFFLFCHFWLTSPDKMCDTYMIYLPVSAKPGLYDIYYIWKKIQWTLSARHCWEIHSEAVLL